MLIGLTGRAGAGKDTVHKIGDDLFGMDVPVERRSFADPLYRSAAAALGVTVEDLDTWKRDPEVRICVMQGDALRARLTVRSYLQRYGTEAHRVVFGDDFWIEAANLGDHAGRLVFVTDVRFTNEADAIRQAGGFVFRVIGPHDPGLDAHPSEEPLPTRYVDGALANGARDDDFVYLRRQVRGLVLWCKDMNGGRW